MALKTLKTPTVVEEVPYGVYVWRMPDGRWVGDGDGNWLNIASMKNDPRRLAELRAAVRSYGITEGEPEFLSGHRQVTDEEFETQRQRLAFGLIPDDHDIPAFREDEQNGYVN